jgi:hypothetical protein
MGTWVSVFLPAELEQPFRKLSRSSDIDDLLIGLPKVTLPFLEGRFELNRANVWPAAGLMDSKLS